MKKFLVLLLMTAMTLSLAACSGSGSADGETAQGETEETEQSAEKETAQEYNYELSEGDALEVENLIFEEDVTVSGNNAQITFTGCEFKGNIINTADEGTRVIMNGSSIDGRCVLQNTIKETTMEWSFPKFIVDSPMEVVSEDCIGSVIAMGGFDVVFNSEVYTMADSELFYDIANPDAGFVPYEGQEADYFAIAQWWENGEQILLVECESDPNM